MHPIRFALIVGLILLSGCSGGNRLRYDTPEEAFNKGKENFDNQKYSKAVEYFQAHSISAARMRTLPMHST